MNNNITNFATKRLLRDYNELVNQPIDNTFAAPEENNIFKWHVILCPISGPYNGISLHLTMTFPNDYPKMPPNVQVSSYLKHPNVFGSYICLDMLKDPEQTGLYVGWTSCYSAHSVLLQLQSFLFDENVPQGGDYKIHNIVSPNEIKQIREAAGNFHCENCPLRIKVSNNNNNNNIQNTNQNSVFGGKFNDNDFPSLDKKKDIKNIPVIKNVPIIISNDSTTKDKVVTKELCISNPNIDSIHYFKKMGSGPLIHLLAFLPTFMDIYHLAKTCKFFKEFTVKHQIIERRELTCFHTKKTFNDNEIILGIGLDVIRFPNSNKINQIQCFIDPISYYAFNDLNVRLSVWKEKFEYFLPLILTKDHAEHAKTIFFKSLRQIHLTNSNEQTMILDVISKMMNSMIVMLMRDEISMMISEKSLMGFCQFHYMLLYYADKYPLIIEKIEAIVSNFLRDPNQRTKDKIPDLGCFIVLLTLSKTTWQEIIEPLFLEVCERNVRWIIRKNPELDKIDNHPINMERIRNTYQASIVSYRLLMFQTYFITHVSRPENQSWKDMLLHYNKTLGTPSIKSKLAMNEYCKKIMKINNYSDFFKIIGLKELSNQNLTKALNNAIVNSRKKGYNDQVNSNGTYNNSRFRNNNNNANGFRNNNNSGLRNNNNGGFRN